MEATAQREIDLHKKVSGSLNQAGFRVNPSSLNPNNHSALHRIKDAFGNTAHVVESYAEEFLTGKGPDTDVRVTPGKGLRRWVLDRFRRKTR